MSAAEYARLNLPGGTAIALCDDVMMLCLAWSSHRGVHVVRTFLPAAWWRQPKFFAQFHHAICDFNLAVALELADLEMTAPNS